MEDKMKLINEQITKKPLNKEESKAQFLEMTE